MDEEKRKRDKKRALFEKRIEYDVALRYGEKKSVIYAGNQRRREGYMDNILEEKTTERHEERRR